MELSAEQDVSQETVLPPSQQTQSGQISSYVSEDVNSLTLSPSTTSSVPLMCEWAETTGQLGLLSKTLSRMSETDDLQQMLFWAEDKKRQIMEAKRRDKSRRASSLEKRLNFTAQGDDLSLHNELQGEFVSYEAALKDARSRHVGSEFPSVSELAQLRKLYKEGAGCTFEEPLFLAPQTKTFGSSESNPNTFESDVQTAETCDQNSHVRYSTKAQTRTQSQETKPKQRPPMQQGTQPTELERKQFNVLAAQVNQEATTNYAQSLQEKKQDKPTPLTPSTGSSPHQSTQKNPTTSSRSERFSQDRPIPYFRPPASPAGHKRTNQTPPTHTTLRGHTPASSAVSHTPTPSTKKQVTESNQLYQQLLGTIVKDIYHRVESQTEVTQSSVTAWCHYMSGEIVNRLSQLDVPYKCIAHVLVLPGGFGGVSMKSGCFWEKMVDESVTVQFDHSFGTVIISLFAISF